MIKPSAPTLPLLLFVEGVHDIEFLRRISRLIAMHESAITRLGSLEADGKLAFIPVGGNGPQEWTNQLSRLARAEFHLYDRETGPETERRESFAARFLNLPERIVVVTSKRSLENYLHPAAIAQITGVRVNFGDSDSVAEIVARELFNAKELKVHWQCLTLRTRKRLRDQAKVCLNRQVVSQMTIEQLNERDPQGEIIGWLRTINQMVRGVNNSRHQPVC